MIYEIIASRRTIRKYKQRSVPKEVLEKCVDAARLSPSEANRQPLKYCIIDDPKLLKKAFSAIRWAGYLPEYSPDEKEMPRAYILILLDKNIHHDYCHDAGIAAMSISMVAYSRGIGSCIMDGIDRQSLKEFLNVPDRLDIILAVALGYPAETPIVDRVRDGDIKYWLDGNGVLHVPKRSSNDILCWNGYN